MYLSPSAYPLGRLGHCDAITGTKAAWGHSEPASGQAVTQLSLEGRRELRRQRLYYGGRSRRYKEPSCHGRHG